LQCAQALSGTATLTTDRLDDRRHGQQSILPYRHAYRTYVASGVDHVCRPDCPTVGCTDHLEYYNKYEVSPSTRLAWQVRYAVEYQYGTVPCVRKFGTERVSARPALRRAVCVSSNVVTRTVVVVVSTVHAPCGGAWRRGRSGSPYPRLTPGVSRLARRVLVSRTSTVRSTAHRTLDSDSPLSRVAGLLGLRSEHSASRPTD
jgi:hypothetical protein